MRVIPDIAYDNHSKAEQRLFETLKATSLEYECVAFHSVALPNHGYKREGEADFVIISRYGLFVLEVKGGGVACHNGKWTTKNQQGAYDIQDPFEQARSATHALNEKILAYVSLEQTRLPLGYGVVFPDILWSYQGMEWDDDIICDSKQISHLKQWLTEFFEYWHRRPANANMLSDTDITAIIDFLRPDFESIQPLFSQVEQVQQQAIKLTKEQYHYVDMAMDNQRVICSGGAGTGKTFLAIELCRRFILQGKTVLLTCHSSWLKHYLSTLIPSDRLVITTLSGLAVTMRRESIDGFDVIVIDEGQDILNIKDLKLLDKALIDGFSQGQWYFFHDINNQSNLFTKLDSNAMAWLRTQNNPSVFKLNINCRNTHNILSKIQTSLDCDLGKSALVEGPIVTEFFGDKKQLSQQLLQLLKTLQASELHSGSVTILSIVSKRKSLLSLLDADVIKNIVELDDYKVKSYPFTQMTFAQIAQFKGLENDVIILLDLKDPQHIISDDEKPFYYVGMSRAKAKLYCFWESDGLT